MGLDIYFYKVQKNNLEHIKELKTRYNELESQSKTQKEYEKHSQELEDIATEWSNSEPEVAYFRKVNFLIPHFGYEENCSTIDIDKCQIEDLVDLCQKVLDARDEKTSEELLPTEGGFFFGGTQYDEYYYDDVQYVLDKFNTILGETDFENEQIKMHCWW